MRYQAIVVAGMLTFAFTACASPYRMQTTLSPDLKACRYKTYTFLEPDDRTVKHWLSDPSHRKSLDDLLRESLAARGLQEQVAGGGTADLQIRQRLETANTMFVTWTVELAEGHTSPAVWSTQMEAVIGDIEAQNLSLAREGLRTAFSGYPRCKK